MYIYILIIMSNNPDDESKEEPEEETDQEKKERLDDEKKVSEEVRAREKVEIIENITLAASGVLLLEGVTAGMEAAIPVLGATGIGIPLAATLFVISKMTRLYASKVELEQVIENSHDVIKRCYLIYSSNMTVIIKFISKISEQEKELKKEDEGDEKIYEKPVFKVQFDKELLSKIKESISIINLLLERVTKNKANKKGRFMRMINRVFSAKFYTNQLLKELTFLNSLFIVFMYKKEKIVKYYENYIKSNYTNSINNFFQDTVTPQIWKEIEEDPEYINDILHPSGQSINLDKLEKAKIKYNPNTEEALKEIEKRAAEELDENKKSNKPGDTPGGGFKTNKRKERRKKITIRIKNFTKKRK
jgi:hypothetical protein